MDRPLSPRGPDGLVRRSRAGVRSAGPTPRHQRTGGRHPVGEGGPPPTASRNRAAGPNRPFKPARGVTLSNENGPGRSQPWRHPRSAACAAVEAAHGRRRAPPVAAVGRTARRRRPPPQNRLRARRNWPRGSRAVGRADALRAIDSTAWPRSWRTYGPRRLRRQSQALSWSPQVTRLLTSRLRGVRLSAGPSHAGMPLEGV
jgi:hypothetical protein